MQKDKEPKKKIKVIPLNKPFAMDLERAKAERLKREQEGASYDENASMAEHYAEYGIPVIPDDKPFVRTQLENGEEYYYGKYIPLIPPHKPFVMNTKVAEVECYTKEQENTEITEEKKAETDQDTQSKRNQVTQTNSEKSPRINFVKEYNLQNYYYKDGELIFMDGKNEMILGNIWLTIDKEIIYLNESINEHNEVVDIKEETEWVVDIECMGRHFKVQNKFSFLCDYNKMLNVTADRAYQEISAPAKREFRKYVNRLIMDGKFTTEYRYKSTGWKKINGKWRYVTDIGVIGEPTLPYKSETDHKFEFAPNLVDDLNTFMDFFNMRKLSEEKMRNTVFLMHYSCLSVMTTLFQELGHGINFVVALIGTTNSQKTATATVFTRLYNRTTKANADIRFDSTEAAILEKTSSYGDSILMIDDLLPYADSTLAKQQNGILREIIRNYGDRLPRMRSKLFSKINNVERYSPVRGCCLITGEVLNLEEESTVTRVIQLDFERGDINLRRLSYYQDNLLSLPTFMYSYISFITENIENIFYIIQDEFANVRNREYPSNMPRRFVDTIAIMSAEIRIFYTYAESKGFLSSVGAQQYKKEDQEFIEYIIMKNFNEAQLENPTAKILASLKWAIEKEKISVYYSPEEKCLEGIKSEDIDNMVTMTDDLLCIRPEKLLEIYRSYCKELNLPNCYKSGRELVQPLKKENVIRTRVEGKEKNLGQHLNSVTNRRKGFLEYTYKSFIKFVENWINFRRLLYAG